MVPEDPGLRAAAGPDTVRSRLMGLSGPCLRLLAGLLAALPGSLGATADGAGFLAAHHGLLSRCLGEAAAPGAPRGGPCHAAPPPAP